MAYPDFMKPFDIYNDASAKQLGVVITQDNRPIVFFQSETLRRAIKIHRYQTRGPLAIVETLKKFNGMLWGQRINVYTDHQISQEMV